MAGICSISRPGFFLAGFFSGMITLGLFSVNTARYPSEVRAIIQPVTVRLAICAVGKSYMFKK